MCSGTAVATEAISTPTIDALAGDALAGLLASSTSVAMKPYSILHACRCNTAMVEQGRAEHRVEIFGTRGAFAIEDSGQVWHAETGADEWKRIETERGRLAEGMRDSSWSRGFTAFAPRIVEALREGRSTVEGAATFEDGYRTQLVLDAARRSNETGCSEKI